MTCARPRISIRAGNPGLGIAAIALGLLLTACSSIGPTTVVRDRVDYASSIANSWKEQTLLNFVKLRYADMPIFLEVAQVIAGINFRAPSAAALPAGTLTPL